MQFRPNLAILVAFGLLLAFACSEASPDVDSNVSLDAEPLDLGPNALNPVSVWDAFHNVGALFERKLHLGGGTKPKPKPKPKSTPKPKTTPKPKESPAKQSPAKQSPTTKHTHTTETAHHSTSTNSHTSTKTSSHTSSSTSAVATNLGRSLCTEENCAKSGSCPSSESTTKTKTTKKVSKRAFSPLDASTNLNTLIAAASNKNLATPKGNANGLLTSGFIPFGDEDKSITITELTGCTAIIAVSKKGVWACHILEFDTRRSVNPYDISPQGYKKMLDRVTEQVKAYKSDLEGGELHIMMPFGNWDSSDPADKKVEWESSWDYSHNWPSRGGKPETSGASYQIAETIISELEDATGIKATTHKYKPDGKPLTGAKGTMVVQYTPKEPSLKDAHAYEVWVEGNPAGNPVSWT